MPLTFSISHQVPDEQVFWAFLSETRGLLSRQTSPRWREAVFALYLTEEKIKPEAVENMRTWPHSGFSVDQSVFLPAGDRSGIERLVQYILMRMSLQGICDLPPLRGPQGPY